MPDIRRTFEYHGAEHKSVACFEKGLELPGGSIKDIAVTIADLLEVPHAKEWEGTALQFQSV